MTKSFKKLIIQVVEGESGIYASLMMPSLIIGTVGGGTSLPTQQESLKLMNCYGPVRKDLLCCNFLIKGKR